MSQEDIDATKAPLMEHLIELRSRLIKAVIAFAIMFALCFIFAKQIYNVLVWPFVWVAGTEHSKFIYTALLEYFITQLKLALFGAGFISFPIVATQIYKFVAPGLYKHERNAFLPYLIATPVFFVLGAMLVYFVVMPMLVRFSLGMQQVGGAETAQIQLLPKVGEYLSLMMSLSGSKLARLAVELPISSTCFFSSVISASRMASWNWPWNSAAIRRTLPIHRPAVRSAVGNSFGPITISATMPIRTSSPQPISNMESETPRG